MGSSAFQLRAIAMLFSFSIVVVALTGCSQSRPEPTRSPAGTAVSISPAWKVVWSGRYSQHIQPIFNQHCVSCHGPARAERKLRLDSHAEVMKGGEHGEVVIPGDPRASVLITSVDGTATGSSRMPPTGPRLNDIEVQNLIVWVEAGAPAD